MKTAEIINSVIGGMAVLLLAAIGRGLLGMRKDFRRFMAEHVWLLATSLWNRDKIRQVMAKLDMPLEDDAPEDLPWEHRRGNRRGKG